MGILDGFVQGAAEQSTNLLNNQMRDDAALDKQKALAAYQAELNDRRERVLMELKQRMADAPLNRIGAKAKEFAGQDVQLEAPPVTELSGKPTEDLKTGGMRGNYEAMVAKAKDLPPEDQKPYLDQLKKQYEADTATAKVGILGQTRKRTNEEALAMAADDAKVNDLPGYMAYESTIGKTERENRRVDSLERKDDLREKKNDAEAADRKARADWLQTHQKERLELDKAIANQRMERGGADDKDPAPVKTAKWLAANKDDPVMMEAWERANLTKSKDIKAIAADLMAKSPGMEAEDAVTKARALAAATDGPDKSQGKPVPTKKDQLVVGETYSTARGLAKWNGTSFEKTK